MRTLITVLLLALPAVAQQTAPTVVVVTPGAASRPAPPTKIVRVAPTTSTAPAGAYDGTRAYRDWRYYGSGGLSRSRASYATWRARFRPVQQFRSVPRVYRYWR